MQNYRDYLTSDHWRRLNEAMKLDRGYRCELCGIDSQKLPLNVHHLTYRHLGHEASGELIVLCRDCHRGWHEDWRNFTGMRPSWPTIVKRLRIAGIRCWAELEPEDNEWTEYEEAKLLFREWARTHTHGWHFYDYCIRLIVCYLRLGEEREPAEMDTQKDPF